MDATEREAAWQRMKAQADVIAENLSAQLPEGVTATWDDAPIDLFGDPPACYGPLVPWPMQFASIPRPPESES